MPRDSTADVRQTLQAVADLVPRFTQLEAYLDELFTWNPQLGLISKQQSPDVAARLIRQSVALWEFVVDQGVFAQEGMPWQIADVGTGGGFPGLIWKLLEPRTQLVLIERKERKAHFLERVVHRLGLTNTHVLAMDVKDVAQDDGFRDRFDLVAVMAVATTGILGPDIEPLLRRGGFLASIRPASQQLVEQRAGESLTLVTRRDIDVGAFVLYQKMS